MAEVIGIVSGSITLVKLFHATVQVFDIVNTGKAYSAEIHTLCSKLEIERTRLLNWGEVVGLTETTAIGPQPNLDSRLYHTRYKAVIEHHLFRLFELFKRADELLDNHGVRLDTIDEESEDVGDTETVTQTAQANQVTRSQVDRVFPQQLETLRRSIRHHQSSISWFRKAKWAVYKGDRFKTFVDEIRELINGLHEIMPDIKARAVERLIQEIQISEDIASLDIVQTVTAGDHDELAEAASSRSELLSVTRSVEGVTITRSEASDAPTTRASVRGGQRRPVSMRSILSSAEDIVARHTTGALVLDSAKSNSRLISCYSRWVGSSDPLPDSESGIASLHHSSFELYFEQSDLYHIDILDAEASRDYLGSLPGTLSISGYMKEIQRHYQPSLPPPRRAARFSPTVNKHLASDEALIGRLEELKHDQFPLNDDPSRDAELLQEILGDKSLYGRTDALYALEQQIEDLTSYLDNRRNCLDVGNVLSVLAEVIGKERGRDMVNFLSQVILSKELERRLQAKRGVSRLQSKLLANSLIISNRFMEGSSLIAYEKSGANRSRSLADMDIRLSADRVERQIDGLIRFAEILKWPYLRAARVNIEDAALRLAAGESLGASLVDWLYCALLPGKWTSVHIMGALVECTPQVEINTFPFFEGGLSLESVSYWRTSSVLGKVLITEGTRSTMGWVGPCSKVDSPATHGYIRLSTRKVGPPTLGRGIEVQTEDLDELRDSSRWFIPAPPPSLMAKCRISSINLRPIMAQNQGHLRATVGISIDRMLTEFTLYTNPHFVTPPQCRLGPHKVHDSEKKMYENIVDVFNLKDFHPNDENVVVINAQCEGGEAYARAWCSEEGRSAVVANERTCCFSCAVKLASSRGIGLNLVIWGRPMDRQLA